MTINFSIDVPNNKLGETLLQLAQVFGHQPVTTTVDPQTEYKRSEPEKAVRPAPVNTEKAVKQTEPPVTAPVQPAEPAPTANVPSYSITTIRAKAKEVAAVKGNGFLRECLDAVGASSISTIAEDRYGEFMQALTA